MLQLGRQGQLYGIEEVTYGTTPALAASNALRHQEFILDFDNKNRRTILEKKQTPFTNVDARTDGRKSGTWKYKGVIRPSGTINTIPEIDFILKAGLGSKTSVALSTTVSAGTGAVGGATLASVVGLAVKDFLLITCPDGKKRLRQILTLPGAGVVTWAPNLPAGQQPADGAAVKGVITYKLTSGLALALSFAHYLKKTDGSAGLKRAADGAGVNDISFAFNANDDAILEAGGECKEVVDAPAQPGGFTMVGGQPPSGITGEALIGNNAVKPLEFKYSVKNGLFLRNDEYGTSAASEVLRKDRAEFSIGLKTRAEDETLLYDLTEAGTNVGMFNQQGFTEGNCMAARAPQVEFKVPKTDDPDDLVNWDFVGMPLETADSASDVFYFAIG